jgi:SAM-dependent methyltransferase
MAGMPDEPGEYRLYQDLAEWWPLISPPAEYAAEAALLAGVFGTAAIPVRDVLDLGSGGGHVAMHLKDRLTLTLLDRSAAMLATSRRLNPECAHVSGDMRTARLGRTFDAVLVHDAVDYITSQDDLRQVIGTAFAHCRPGGIAVFVPDYTAETFQAGSGGGGSSTPDGRQGSFREWRWDPDPADDWIQVEYEFVLREAGGAVQTVRETHRLGAFARATWLRLLAGAGFTVQAAAGPAPGSMFTGHRPLTA